MRVPVRFVAFLLLLGVAPPLAAQPRLVARLAPDTGATGTRAPLVRVDGLLADERWTSALESGLPLRLHFRLQRWRVRGSWFDDPEQVVDWDVVVRRDPLREEYAVETTLEGRRSARRYATTEALSAALGYSYLVRMAPRDRGTYYYQVLLNITTLSDSDLAELERFLRGDLGSAAAGEDGVGDALGRGARRLLLRIAGLPSLRLDARSGRFEVR
ncbi:MAG TPA: hypothetical protein VLA95_10315 [Gemmatimonadales bacterium]|nr:hypothetical protein [Gemmatimonadales bacterium]